jgi:uncharacterized membrane protein (UPF0127 family)
MQNKRVSFKFNGKNLSFDVKKCNSFEKGVGLMFKRRKNAEALLFEFEKNSEAVLTSWFVFSPFAVFWLDDKNKVVDFKIVKPFVLTINAKKPFSKIVEVPLNDKYTKDVTFRRCLERFKKKKNFS